MENLNKAGKIKIIVLIVCFLMNVLAPMNMVVQLNLLIAILFPILFGVIALPLIVKLNNSKEIMTPLWNDNPFTDNKPISFFHLKGIQIVTYRPIICIKMNPIKINICTIFLF